MAGAHGWNINGQVPGGMDRLLVRAGFLLVGGLVGERRGCVVAGWPFGTLLGPEATGPGGFGLSRDVVSGFLAARVACMVVCVGCVVRGCCLRTT